MRARPRFRWFIYVPFLYGVYNPQTDREWVSRQHFLLTCALVVGAFALWLVGWVLLGAPP
jgi:hypothetical protein